MGFSSRTPDDLSPNPITEVLGRLKSGSFLDLTVSNPTQCGFEYPKDLFQGLNSPQVMSYEPDPFGNMMAREAVSGYLRDKGHRVGPSNLLLTASTSEAYSYIFKLLGNPEDSFLVPAPGYPLLDHLLQLDSLEPLPYSLRAEPNWPVDLNEAKKLPRANTKGLIVVNPQNPTGCFLSPNEQTALLNLCLNRQLAYISDEVFSDFPYPGHGLAMNPTSEVLSFRLGGLSKSLGLPQLKLSWIAIDGPKNLLSDCLERLELIADTYLSVNTPVQLALEELLRFAPNFQKQVLERVLRNRSVLEESFKALAEVKVWPAQGGWYALVEVQKKGVRDDELVIQLLEKQGVFVQPGGFYDFQSSCFLVLSLLAKSADFIEGVRRIHDFLNELKN